jgi:hypothetical protein
MNSQGNIEFTRDVRTENIQQHAFSSVKGRQIASINANLYTIYSSGRLTFFLSCAVCAFEKWKKKEIQHSGYEKI